MVIMITEKLYSVGSTVGKRIEYKDNGQAPFCLTFAWWSSSRVLSWLDSRNLNNVKALDGGSCARVTARLESL